MGLYRCDNGGSKFSVAEEETLISSTITYTAEESGVYIAQRVANPSTATSALNAVSTTGEVLKKDAGRSGYRRISSTNYYTRAITLIAKLKAGDTISFSTASKSRCKIWKLV